MKVSIVTISYNQEPFLERAICSVLDQDYPDLEHIIVDPGSTDGSRAVIEQYSARSAKVILEPDSGPGDGLNKGFALATGDAFAFLNSDDILLPGAVREAVTAFSAAPQADVVYGHGFIIDEHDRVIRHFFSDRFDLWRFIYGGVSIVQQSAFFRREAFRTVGGFNPYNRTCWDHELWLDLALAGKTFCLFDAYWSSFRLHPDSISGSGSTNASYQAEMERLFQKATGRDPTALDNVRRLLARTCKWCLNPRGAVQRMRDQASSLLAATTLRAADKV